MTGRLGIPLVVVLALGCRGGTGDTDDLAEPIEAAAPADRLDDRTDDKPGFLAALTPKQTDDIMAPYTSAAAHLAVKLGDPVAAGQVVARLDDRQLRQELDAGRAQLRTAQAAVTQAQVDKRGAEIVLAREKNAEAAGVGSRADLATATQTVARATAAITVARATADERATRLAQLQVHLSEMTLTSSIAGNVALIYGQDGARVEEGHPVLRVISGGVYVKFAIPADKAGSVQPGDLVDLRLDRRPELLAARVSHVAPELDGVAQMIIADAELVNSPADLQPGTVGRILPRAGHPAAGRPSK
ncbi:MAG TPA: HlyD family efflux transporter periplasmic adaptor subunit [Kofleriaceae bacterium]|jgi:HlyD family secretion protein|nr:HlyD family efflux transporter periplasmic adaptor subunit [Kofleriaceae bacterium]